MRRAARMAGAALALALGLSGAVTGTAGAATSYSFAVIGDVPYGSTQLGLFPKRIAQINADPNVKMVSHLGDIGSGNCSSSYYQKIKSNFDKFVDPLVYTPGDNEWAGGTRWSGSPLSDRSSFRPPAAPWAKTRSRCPRKRATKKTSLSPQAA